MNARDLIRTAFESWYRTTYDWPTFPAMDRYAEIEDKEKAIRERLSGRPPGHYQRIETQRAWEGFIAGTHLAAAIKAATEEPATA